MPHEWVKSFPGAIVVCDTNGIILEINNKAIEMFKEDGGEKLIGKKLLDCHPQSAHSQIEEMLKREKPNYYTIEKRGVKKIICQVPWYRAGTYAGFVELSLPIPFEIPHFIRT
jgi:transcriptional regulator with PAS, ATPase and Fis domain